jgi:hypothetical protein
MVSFTEYDVNYADVIAKGIGPEISQSIKDIYSAAKVWSVYALPTSILHGL